MSTQSGITVSSDLLQSFQQLDHDFLVIKINQDSTELIVDPEAPKTNHSFDKRFNSLLSYVESIHPHPVYIVLTIEEDPRKYAFISFIPDIAHIRDKMLYASTRNTILQELGSNNIDKNYVFAWSELEEIDLNHFKSLQASNSKNSQVLSEEETLKKLETLDSVQAGYSKPLASMSGNQLLFKFDDELTSELNNPEHKLVLFKIGSDETFKLVNSLTDIDIDALVETVESVDTQLSPRFIVYNYIDDKYSLIYSCPSGSKVRDRMIYASNKQGLTSFLKTKLDLDKVLEVGDMEELDIHELKPATEQALSNLGLRFNKPKGPRRR